MIIDWAGGSLIVMLLLITMVSLLLGMGLPVTAAYIVLATISAPSLADLITTGALVDQITSGALPETAVMMLSLADPGIGEKIAAGLSADEARRLLAAMPIELRAALRPQLLTPEIMTASLLAAHMIIFWVSQDSNVTPPVCLPAFVAAAIAGSPPMKTGFAAFRLCKGLYLIPLLFAFTPILSGDWGQMLLVFVPAIAGLHALSGAMSGWLETRQGVLARIVLSAVGAALLWPLEIEIKAVILVGYLGYVFFDWRLRRSQICEPARAWWKATG